MPELLDSEIEKIIYFDSDTIINLDINELWQIELKDKALAVVTEADTDSYFYKMRAATNFLITSNLVNYADYFNAGVLVFNLNRLKNSQGLLNEGLNFVSNNLQCKYFDQDVLNYCFSQNAVKLPENFNSFVTAERLTKKIFKIRRAVYHYVNNSLDLNLDDIFNELFFKYFVKTPFFNEDIIGNLYGGIQQLYIQQKNFSRQVSALISGKTRSFFVPPNSLEAVKQIFYVQPNEEIILADSPASLQTLINSMQKFKGKKIYFLLLPNEFSQVQEILTRAGFSPSKDFFNAMEFLSDAEGVPLNSYSLLKLL